MALTTLSAVKTHLRISGSGEDAALTALLRGASQALKSYVRRNLGDVISGISVAASAVVTSLGHGLETGDEIVVYGSDSTPSIDGARAVTRLSEDTFSVPLTTSGAGTAGFFARTFTEYHRGRGTLRLYLRETPVQSITAVYLDDAGYWEAAAGEDPFGASTLLTAGSDYALVLDDSLGRESRGGLVERLGGVWPGLGVRHVGLLAGETRPGAGNIKVVYVGGHRRLPDDVQLAAQRMVALLRSELAQGGPLKGGSLDYYSYQRLEPELQAKALGSVQSLLGRYRPWVW